MAVADTISNLFSEEDRAKTEQLNFSEIQEWKERLRRSAKRKNSLTTHWDKCLALYRGEHWKYTNPTTGQLAVDHVFSQRSIIINLIRNMCHVAAANVYGERREPEFVPNIHQGEESIIAARNNTLAIRHLNQRNKTESLNYQLLVNCAIFGTCFKYATWDDQAVASVKQPQYMIEISPDGSPVVVDMREEIVRGPYGDVREGIALPYEVFLPEGVTELDDDTGWVIRALIKPVQYIKNRYGDQIAEQVERTTGGAYTDQAFSDMRDLIENFERSGDRDVASDSDKTVNVYECWKKYPDLGMWGRFVIVGSMHLNPGEDLFPFLPLTEYHWFPEPAAFWGTGLITDLERPQRLYNYYHTQALHSHRLSAKPFVMLPKNAQASPITNEYATIVEYKGNQFTAKPVVINFKSMPQEVIQALRDLKNEMYDISGIQPATLGISQANVRSAEQFQSQRESGVISLDKINQAFFDQEARHAKKQLALMRNGYTEMRWIQVVGASWGSMAKEISGDSLDPYCECQYVRSRYYARSFEERMQLTLQLAQSGLFQPGREAELKRVSEILNLSTGSEDVMFDDENSTFRQVAAENAAFKKGEVAIRAMQSPDDPSRQIQVVVNQRTGSRPFKPYQDHYQHIEYHNRMRNTTEFESWTPQAQELYSFHIDMEHGGFIANQMRNAKQEQIESARENAKIEQLKKMNPTGRSEEDLDLDDVLGLLT